MLRMEQQLKGAKVSYAISLCIPYRVPGTELAETEESVPAHNSTCTLFVRAHLDALLAVQSGLSTTPGLV
eukprot:1376787-Rhodomonas_salina.2